MKPSTFFFLLQNIEFTKAFQFLFTVKVTNLTAPCKNVRPKHGLCPIASYIVRITTSCLLFPLPVQKFVVAHS